VTPRSTVLNRNGSALLVALFALLLAGALSAALAELARLSVERARMDRDGVRTWFLAEAGLAETIASIEPGSHFDAPLTAQPGPLAETGAPGSHTVAFSDDVDDSPNDPLHDINGRVWLRLAAFGSPPIRRRLEALLERDLDALFPGAVTIAGDIGTMPEGIALDGRDFDVASGCTITTTRAARLGLAIPLTAPIPAIDHPEQINGMGGFPSIARASPANLTSLASGTDADRFVSGPLPETLGTASSPRFTLVEGEALVSGDTTGGGALYVGGRLTVSGSLEFTGVVAVGEGIEVTSGGRLVVCGAVWAAGSPALTGLGTGSIHAASDAIRTAGRVAALPARPRAKAIRELF